MRERCFIPIKANRRRVVGKNFAELGGQPLFVHAVGHAVAVFGEDLLTVDTDSEAVLQVLTHRWPQIEVLDRHPDLAGDDANGNHLLQHWAGLYPDLDWYWQWYVTSPFLSPDSVRALRSEILIGGGRHDSGCTVERLADFIWHRSEAPHSDSLSMGMQPLYDVDRLPRSQDLMPIFRETTGVYATSAQALKETGSRLGGRICFHPVSRVEAIDINDDQDLDIARMVWRSQADAGGDSPAKDRG